MPSYPRTLLDFERWFRTEEACRDYLAKLRWPQGFLCSRCEHRQAWRTHRGVFHCAKCRVETSVTAGTIFHRSRIPLRLWFRAMWHVTDQKNGINALSMQRILGLGSYRTAWRCLHKLRRAMARPDRELLSGTIEVGETVVVGEWVGLAVEVRGKECGRARLVKIPGTHAVHLENFVLSVAAKGSRIVTDGRPAYARLPGHGYVHRRMIADYLASKEDLDPILPRVHIVSSLLKRWLLGVHHGAVLGALLPGYLHEFMFRFNRRASPDRGMLFYRLAHQAVATKPFN